MAQIAFRVNGQSVWIRGADSRTLLDVLREELGLTGTKRGCEIGECGTCLVLLDRQPTNSCLVFAGELKGTEVVTVEGLARGDALHPVQQAFIDCSAAQCGFCTPGFLIAAVALLERNPDPTEEEVREGLGGNLCRCTGYKPIIDAVLRAAERIALVC